MSNIFNLRANWLLVFPLSMGLMLPTPFFHLVASANEVSNSPSRDNSTQERSESGNTLDRPSAQEPNRQPADVRRDDRVYIDEIYPEYCRSYFLSRDWVTIFQYHEGMHRCLYGSPD